jgi:DNA-binding transcriptional LysR family regulator
MDIDDIRLFVKVAEYKSFVRAASELRLQTSLLSRRVARLEAALGVRLLQRTTRRVSLTEEGRKFLVQTTRGLDQLSAAVESLSSVHGAPQGKVRVAGPIELSQLLVEGVMPDFFRDYPDIQIEWDVLVQYSNMIESGVDLAIRATKPDEQTLVTKKIGSAKYRLFRAPHFKHSITRKTTAAELEKLPWAVFVTGPIEDQRASYSIHLGGVQKEIQPKNVRFRANSLSLVRNVLVQGLGIGFLPPAISDPETRAGRLIPILPDHILGPALNFYAVYPSREYLSPKVRVLVDWLTHRFPFQE